MNTGKVSERLKRKDKRTILLICVTAFMALLALISIFFVIRSYLPVREFELSGVTQYEKPVVVSASGIRPGDKIYSLDLEAAKKNILSQLPYIQSVEIERNLFGKIVFRVEERRAVWYMQLSGDYYALDSALTVIEETPKNDKFIGGGATYLVLPNLQTLMCGEVPKFGSGEVEVVRTLELINAVQSDPLKSRITSLDVESRFNVYLTVDGIYDVYIGDMSNVTEKLLVVRKLLESGDLDEFKGASIDVSDPESMVVKPKYE